VLSRIKLRALVESRVAAKTDNRCAYCGIEFTPESDMVIEHIIPSCRGGSDDLANLLPSCGFCNTRKGKKSIEEFRTWFAKSIIFDLEHKLILRLQTLARISSTDIAPCIAEMNKVAETMRGTSVKFYFEKIGLKVPEDT